MKIGIANKDINQDIKNMVELLQLAYRSSGEDGHKACQYLQIATSAAIKANGYTKGEVEVQQKNADDMASMLMDFISQSATAKRNKRRGKQ